MNQSLLNLYNLRATHGRTLLFFSCWSGSDSGCWKSQGLLLCSPVFSIQYTIRAAKFPSRFWKPWERLSSLVTTASPGNQGVWEELSFGWL